MATPELRAPLRKPLRPVGRRAQRLITAPDHEARACPYRTRTGPWSRRIHGRDVPPLIRRWIVPVSEVAPWTVRGTTTMVIVVASPHEHLGAGPHGGRPLKPRVRCRNRTPGLGRRVVGRPVRKRGTLVGAAARRIRKERGASPNDHLGAGPHGGSPPSGSGLPNARKRGPGIVSRIVGQEGRASPSQH